MKIMKLSIIYTDFHSKQKLTRKGILMIYFSTVWKAIAMTETFGQNF